jgi:hypothetical protein
MTVDLRIVPHTEKRTDTVGDRDADTIRHDGAVDVPPPPPSREQPMPGTGPVRFDLEPRSVPDMRCGVNGVPFVQTFGSAARTGDSFSHAA